MRLRSYLGISLPKNAVNYLVRAQRELHKIAKERKLSIEPLERSLLLLPLDDLGEVLLESLEAVDLAMQRVVCEQAPFSLHVEGLGGTPDARRPRIIWARVEASEALLSLRERLHLALKIYGFELEPGSYLPQLPLARVPSGFGPLPEEFQLKLRFRVEALSLFIPNKQRRGARFRVGLRRALGHSAENPHPSSWLEETKAGIDARLDEILNVSSEQRSRSKQQLDQRR